MNQPKTILGENYEPLWDQLAKLRDNGDIEGYKKVAIANVSFLNIFNGDFFG
jgi:hypothetical protein